MKHTDEPSNFNMGCGTLIFICVLAVVGTGLAEMSLAEWQTLGWCILTVISLCAFATLLGWIINTIGKIVK